MFARLIEDFKNWCAVRKTEKALYALSPHQLEDIGLTSWSIPTYIEGMRAERRRVTFTKDDISAYAKTQAAKGHVAL